MANSKQRSKNGVASSWTPIEASGRPAVGARPAGSASPLDDPMLALNPSALHDWARPSVRDRGAGEVPAKARDESGSAPSEDAKSAPGIGSMQPAVNSEAHALGANPGGPSEAGELSESIEPIRVLLADDHVVVRAGICSLLESLDGVEVVGQASNGHEALRLLEARASQAAMSRLKTDIAILDISMSGMNGLEAAGHIKRLHPETRVIMLSMHDSEEYVKQALNAGASGYLLKESGFNELEGALRAVARGEVYLSPGVSRHLVNAFINRASRDSLSSPTAQVKARPEAGENTGKARSRSGSGDSSGEAVVLTPRQQEILRLLAQGLSNGQIASRLSISIKTVETHRAGLMNRLNIFDIVGLVRYAIHHGFIEPL